MKLYRLNTSTENFNSVQQFASEIIKRKRWNICAACLQNKKKLYND